MTRDNSANLTNKVQLAVAIEKIEGLEKAVGRIETQLSSNYVSNDKFTPVRNIVYGMVALILTAVVGYLMSLILK